MSGNQPGHRNAYASGISVRFPARMAVWPHSNYHGHSTGARGTAVWPRVANQLNLDFNWFIFRIHGTAAERAIHLLNMGFPS